LLTRSPEGFRRRLADVALPEALAAAIRPLIAHLAQLDEQIATADKDVAKGRPAGAPDREIVRDSGAAPCGLSVERREPRAVWEMTAVIEGAERDLALDDPEQGDAPAPVLGDVRQLCELPAPHPAPSEVRGTAGPAYI
jgi:hypothetical protein